MIQVKWRTLGGVVAALLSVAAGPQASAAAAEALGAAATHCVVEAKPIGDTELAESVCFDSEDLAVDYVLSLIASSSARGASASTILGTAYKDADGGGSSFTFWGSSGCAGVVFGFSSLTSGWDNSISSAGGSNGCWLTLYSATSYGGSGLNCTPWCGSVFGLNDSVKSLVFRPAGTFG